MKCLKFIAMVAIATGLSTASRAQYAPQGKPVAKAIDSVNIAGVPFNTLLIGIASLTDSVATVNSQLRYSGGVRNGSSGSVSFRDTLQTTPSVGISINGAALRIAAKHGLTLQ